MPQAQYFDTSFAEKAILGGTDAAVWRAVHGTALFS